MLGLPYASANGLIIKSPGAKTRCWHRDSNAKTQLSPIFTLGRRLQSIRSAPGEVTGNDSYLDNGIYLCDVCRREWHAVPVFEVRFAV